MRAANSPDSAASPKSTGTIGCDFPPSSKPSADISERKRAVLLLSASRNAGDSSSSSKAARDAAATDGASVFEKRYGRAFWRSVCTISFLAAVYPPVAPPIAFPSVELTMSTSPQMPHASSVPRPRSPRKPVAWHSSMKRSASCLRVSASISFRGAMSPSMEKTPSVATSLARFPLVSMSFCSRSAKSICLKRCRSALHKRMPSMMDAWLRASEMTASSEVRIASKRPAFASKHDG
mmetsp:Transcript_19852/g.64588  ORF Transcript_19852/g.64588 Transcript_19852/m.64588 type:complete len:236 (+) Transcript_19852:230-937(+)